jgi:hypothetical protein
MEHFMFKYDKNSDKTINEEEFNTFLEDLKDNIQKDPLGCVLLQLVMKHLIS